MKPIQFIFAAFATLLLSSVLWSCNKDKAPPGSATARSAPKRPSPPSKSSDMPGTGGGMMDQLRAGCPMVVQGAKVTVTDTEAGVALSFTTDTGEVADLRTRVTSMAQMYQMHRGQAGMMWHHMGGGGMGGGGMGGRGVGDRGMGGEGMGGEGMGGEGMGGKGMGGKGMGGKGMGGEGMGGEGMGGEGMGHMAGRGPMPAASDTVTDTDKGARLELRPTDPSQLGALREHVRWHQQRMQSGECWMLQGQPTDTPRGEE